MSATVVVFGATGRAGSEVVRQCLADPRIGEVRAVTRRSLDVEHPKVREVRSERFDELETIRADLRDVDACFYCLGIAQAQAESEAHYRTITVEYPLAAARTLKRESPAHTFAFLSGQGADPRGRSWMMWARVKGEAENELGALGLARLLSLRPGYIHPEPGYGPRGVGGALARALFPVVSALAPGSAITSVELARGMIEAALGDEPSGVLENGAIRALARRAA